MSSYKHILRKLEMFTRRYYMKVLLRGVLLFFTGLLLLGLLVSGVEYFLWLPTGVRTVLFYGGLVLVVFLGVKYLVIPVMYLVKVRRGITSRDAAGIIGSHFPQIGDRLMNLVELSNDGDKTDLLMAAIEERSSSMVSMDFRRAVGMKTVVRYAGLLIIPISIIFLIAILGNLTEWVSSYKRVVNYDIAFEAPAPFRFLLLNEDLNALENEEYVIRTQVVGKVLPEEVMVELNGETLVMNRDEEGYYLRLEPPLRKSDFKFIANQVTSRVYSLEVYKVPALQSFEMRVVHPKYLGGKEEVIVGNGNTTMPEGGSVKWTLAGRNIDTIKMAMNGDEVSFKRSSNDFLHERKMMNSANYEIVTSNEGAGEYERLGYAIEVVKDQSPRIKVFEQEGFDGRGTGSFEGTVTDDYGVSKLEVVYRDVGERKEKRYLLAKGQSAVVSFDYVFPTGLFLEKGKSYELYFEVTDNDVLRGGKSSRSRTFGFNLLDDDEEQREELKRTRKTIDDLEKEVEKWREPRNAMEEINRQAEVKRELSHQDRKNVKTLLNKQQQQERLMKEFSRQLQKGFESVKENEQTKMLMERLERQEQEAKRNEKLLEELNKVAEKISKEDLKKELDKLAKSQNSRKRGLDQLVELTKRFYVSEKAAQLAERLRELAKRQQELAQSTDGAKEQKEQQEKLNTEFDILKKELTDLKKDNRGLKKPMKLKYNTNQQESISSDQKEAYERLEKIEQEGGSQDKPEQGTNAASAKQQSAAEKMRSLAKMMESSSGGGGGGSSIVEDAEMLRQILDNLVVFSLEQEELFDDLENKDENQEGFSGVIHKQQQLKDLFEHVDDSLFALSLRRAELSDFVNDQITEVYYNTDKVLENVAENNVYKAASYQQYIISASNELAEFLASMLDNMQQGMSSGQGQGQGMGFQLPDLIRSQEELQKQMGQGEGDKGGQQGNEGGEKGGQGKSGEQGKEGSSGNNGEEGGQGNPGNERGHGEGHGEGGNKGSGKNGEGKGEGRNGKGQGEGQEGQRPGGQQMSEGELKEVYEIYQEQQRIREKLESQLNDIISKEEMRLGKQIIQEMENLENELLNNGITEKGREQMNDIKHRLLRLENAAFKQGKKEERESNSNDSEYEGIEGKTKYGDTPRGGQVEILSRQVLPLQIEYQKRVREYFDGKD